MASKIAFVSCFTLLVTLTSAAVTTSAKCALTDTDCVTEQARLYLDDFVKGNPALGISSLNQMDLGVVKDTVEGFYFEFDDVTTTTIQNVTLENLTFDTNFNVAIVEFKTSLSFCFPKFTTNGIIFMASLDATGSGCITSDDIRFYLAIPYSIIKNSNGDDILNLVTYDYGYTIRNITYDFSFDDSSLNIVNTLLNKVTQVLGRLHGPSYYGKVSDIVVNALNVTAANTPLSNLVTY